MHYLDLTGTKVYIVDSNQLLKNNCYQYYFNKMPISRQKKANKFLFEKDKMLCVAAYACFLESLKHNNINVDNLNFIYNENKKPYLSNMNLKFNLSHSGCYAVCGISNFEIGVDIQIANTYDDNLLNYCMLSDEIKNIKTHSNDSKNLFYQYWTIKESIMKAIGCGMNLHPNKIFCKPNNVQSKDYSISIYDDFYSIDKYSLKTFDINDSYVCSTCVLSENENISYSIIDLHKC